MEELQWWQREILELAQRMAEKGQRIMIVELPSRGKRLSAVNDLGRKSDKALSELQRESRNPEGPGR